MPHARADELVLIRHGETEWSRSGKHTGHTDIHLTEEGRLRAAAIGGLLRAHTFAACFSSPLARAKDTAVLAGLAITAIDPDLIEVNYGSYEGITTAEIRQNVPGWSVWTHPLTNGETLEQCAARADLVLERADQVVGDVALVAHGHILRILAARWLGLGPQEGSRLALDTASVSVLGYERETRVLRRWNQTTV
jgi:broad specificity phosphatase PhoE